MNKFDFVTHDEVLKLVTRPEACTNDSDLIPLSLIKQNIDILCHVVAKLVNDSLQGDHFHDQWKIATVLPLLKKPCVVRTLPMYRPVSTLGFVPKLVEKGDISQINRYLSENQLSIKVLIKQISARRRPCAA